VEGAGGAGKGLPHGNIDDISARVDKQIAVVRGQTLKSQFPVAQAASLGAEFEPVGHIFLIHGASSENKKLIARFFQGLFQRKAHCL